MRNGGPAFPIVSTGEEIIDTGMSLLDWFAGQALKGMIAHPNWMNTVKGAGASEEKCAAHYAYQFADEMLIERERRAKEGQ